MNLEAMARIDPQLNPSRNDLRYDVVVEEMRGERAHDASVASVQDRLTARVAADPALQSLVLQK